MPRSLRPRSIRARYTIAATVVSLVFLTTIGGVVGISVRNKVQARVYAETQRVAAEWISAMAYGDVSRTVPKSHVNLLQVVDVHGRIVGSSAAMSGKPPLSTLRPPVDDRIEHLTQCSSAGKCVLLTAIRLSPAEAGRLRLPDSPVVYAGMRQPPILATHRLELFLSAAIALIAALIAWTTWWAVGRTLRPVEAIRTRTAEITLSDLSLRLPQPPGDDEIAQLARTTNQTLVRLEAAVEQQRNFASVVSHELRNPVAGLHTQLEEALLYPGDVDAHDTIQAALSTTGRLQAIIDDLLALARLRTAVPEAPAPVNLGALVETEAAARVRGVPVRAHISGEVKVLGNELQLIRALNNLLVNAQRHAEAAVEITVERSDGQAVVTVTDDGDGIAPEDRELVFEPFVRLSDGHRRDPGGSGLGLPICRAIISAHCGTLRIEDSPRGARFVIRLPLIDGDRRATATGPCGSQTRNDAYGFVR
ncbi:HAMP domain-containing histidine kinase [Sphaerisporangium sp. NBC_01403]|uniref:sensor histidine kinase n=1 Tax=Sphaerisporangium sp. NBC_01403 TaxID=2903599 RepID=UPI003254C9D6